MGVELLYNRVMGIDEAVSTLKNSLVNALLSNSKVVWFVPGGSNIPISVATSKAIPDNLRPRLSVTLTDERFGSYGHKDSNWQQLKDLGFDFASLNTVEFLQKGNLNLADTQKITESRLKNIIKDAYLFGQFGIGTDGHIAGIKPNSPAVNSKNLVCGYKAKDFIRLTTTLKLIKQLNEAHIFALGKEKLKILEKLKNNDEPLEAMPAQIVKKIKKAVIYSEEETT